MTPKILYIEDDPASRSLVEQVLTEAGYAVEFADRGLQGIELARQILPDLILTDLMLPDLSGREITTILRCDARFQSTPFVALTGQGLDGRALAMAAGVNGYIMKPVNIRALPRQLQYYLSGGQDEVEAQELAEAQLEYTREVVLRLEKRIRDLEAAKDTLLQLDRLKDTFIQLTSHELRTPLTLIFGYSRLLFDHPAVQEVAESDENLKGLVRGMSGGIERLRGIVEELLMMSHILTNRIDMTTAPTDLGAIIQKLLRNNERILEERQLVVFFNVEQWPRAVQADSELLKLMLWNLLSNAIKYTPDGGKIYLNAKTNGEYVRLSIKDSGIGIDKSDQQRIFERFHTTRDVSMHTTSKTAFGGGGLGLGLPICKGIVEAHGGRLWVESAGHDPVGLPGSEFIVELPLDGKNKVKPTSTVIKRL